MSQEALTSFLFQTEAEDTNCRLSFAQSEDSGCDADEETWKDGKNGLRDRSSQVDEKDDLIHQQLSQSQKSSSNRQNSKMDQEQVGTDRNHKGFVMKVYVKGSLNLPECQCSFIVGNDIESGKEYILIPANHGPIIKELEMTHDKIVQSILRKPTTRQRCSTFPQMSPTSPAVEETSLKRNSSFLPPSTINEQEENITNIQPSKPEENSMKSVVTKHI